MAVTSRNKLLESSSVPYLVMRDLLFIQLNPPANPRFVMIPAHSVVKLKRRSFVPGFAELIWEHRTHMIFEADLTRLSAGGKGVNSRGHAREAYFAGMRRWNDEKSPTKTERGSML